MQRLLFVDTETTGLPRNRYSNAMQGAENWPDIVSIAWKVYDGPNFVRAENHLIKPMDWTISEGSTKIHGITNEHAQAKGENLHAVMLLLKKDLESSDSVVAHNLEFDKNVIFNAYKWRLDLNPWLFWPRDEICTMNRAEPELKIPNKYPKEYRPYKSPSLAELYQATFQDTLPVGLQHSADFDVGVLSDIYWKRWGQNDSRLAH